MCSAKIRWDSGWKSFPETICAYCRGPVDIEDSHLILHVCSGCLHLTRVPEFVHVSASSDADTDGTSSDVSDKHALPSLRKLIERHENDYAEPSTRPLEPAGQQEDSSEN